MYEYEYKTLEELSHRAVQHDIRIAEVVIRHEMETSEQTETAVRQCMASRLEVFRESIEAGLSDTGTSVADWSAAMPINWLIAAAGCWAVWHAKQKCMRWLSVKRMPRCLKSWPVRRQVPAVSCRLYSLLSAKNWERVRRKM